MIGALKAIGYGLNDFRLKGYTYIWANVAFVILSLPLITIPAAIAALFRVSHHVQTEPTEAGLEMFWEAFKSSLRVDVLLWGVANVLFAVVNFTNLAAYASVTDPAVMILRTIWYIAGIIWLGLLLYTWPLYYEMADPSLIGAMRNALVMVLQNPFFTATIIICAYVLTFLSFIFVAAWALVTFAVIAAVATAAVLERLRLYRSMG